MVLVLCQKSNLKIAVELAQARGENIVMTNGCFDILHAGHVSYLTTANTLGSRLIVAVNDDASVTRLKGPGRPVNPVDRRMAVLAGLGAVDWVVPFSEDTPQRLIANILPNTLVKGGDYKVEDIAGGQEVIAAGGEVKVLNFEDGISTTKIINAIRQRIIVASRLYLRSYITEHRKSSINAAFLLKRFNSLRCRY